MCVKIKKIKEVSAYTMTEILTVVIVASVLLVLVLPRITDRVRKTQVVEGIKILTAVREAQSVFFYENQDHASNPNQLEIDISTMGHFQNLAIFAPGDGCIAECPKGPDDSCVGATGEYTASLEHNELSYSLYACATGEVVCSPANTWCN